MKTKKKIINFLGKLSGKTAGEMFQTEIEEATKGMAFHQDVTLCDKYVAFNAFANDLNGTLADDLILKSAYAFWFADKDWHGEDRIWKYMCLSHKQ